MNIEAVHSEFHQRLGKFGRVVIAGGAVRDTLMGKQPKDWDIFILKGEKFDFKTAKPEIAATLEDLAKVAPVVDWHNSEPFLVATVKWNAMEVQVLVNPQPTMAHLIGTFDWNVCLFGYDGTYLHGEGIENIGVGKTLKLNRVTFPASTLRRGYRFSERFKMKLEYATVVDLCRQIAAKADAKKDVGPDGNEPDMPSLAKNILADNAELSA